MKSYIIIACILLAASTNTTAGWTEWGTVTNHYANENGGSYVSLSSPIHNPAGCAGPGWYRYEKSSSIYNDIAATILAAKVSGKTIRLFIDETTCSFDNPKIRHLMM